MVSVYRYFLPLSELINMRILSRMLTLGLAMCLLSALPTATGQAQFPSSLSAATPGISQIDQGFEEPRVLDTQIVDLSEGPFRQWGIPTPPGAEGYEVNQIEHEEGLNPRGVDEWHPTVNPNEEVVDGLMRSDYETVPEEFSKSEANRAEITEARLHSDETSRQQARSGCSVYWPSWFEVCGAIKAKYDSIGGPTSFLKFPVTNELTNPDGSGKRNHFNNGYIYWHPRTGAHTVSLPADVVWKRHGREQGFLGYPTTSDIALGNSWYKQSFEGGYVYTHNSLPISQASIQGAIYDKWQSMGAQNSDLGYPISDEITTTDGIGRFNVFEGGMIYWTPSTGAHEVINVPLMIWALHGFESSEWGYPVASPTQAENSPVFISQEFSNGQMNVFSEFENSGEVLINNKPVSRLAVDLLAESGLSVDTIEDMSDAPNLRAVSRCPIPDSTQPQYGTVTIPASYDYWSCIPGSLDWPNIGYHDYCTKSPDQYPAVGKNAEFSGACARHDQCMDAADVTNSGYWSCNARLHSDMETICTSVYSGTDIRRYNCRDFRDVYWVVVTGAHSGNL